MTINRRLFIGSLAAVTAGIVPFANSAAIIAAPNTSLTTVRYILLPGLWGITEKHRPDYESDIMIDYEADALIVKAYRFSTKQEFGFAILRPSIESGRYKAEFAPAVNKLFKVLTQANAA